MSVRINEGHIMEKFAKCNFTQDRLSLCIYMLWYFIEVPLSFSFVSLCRGIKRRVGNENWRVRNYRIILVALCVIILITEGLSIMEILQKSITMRNSSNIVSIAREFH